MPQNWTASIVTGIEPKSAPNGGRRAFGLVVRQGQ
jgi:hypothetical protein